MTAWSILLLFISNLSTCISCISYYLYYSILPTLPYILLKKEEKKKRKKGKDISHKYAGVNSWGTLSVLETPIYTSGTLARLNMYFSINGAKSMFCRSNTPLVIERLFPSQDSGPTVYNLIKRIINIIVWCSYVWFRKD